MSEAETAIKAWWRRFWWIRGFLAALALFQLVPVFTDLSAHEFLRGFHFVIFGWEYIANEIGALADFLLFFPEFSSEFVSAIIIAITVTTPSFFAVLNARVSLIRNEAAKRRAIF